ncbi:MAG: D-sedoheptulose 7-phosphate isomerase [Candidatus Woesearchaeota archaeon]|nr:D-sedoheptulose 7-phosphate isomerase [Candidatus Woesearchaeota archaeon]
MLIMKFSNEFVKSIIKDSISVKEKTLEMSEEILRAGETIAQALLDGNKVLTCGNGGSAADAQHFAAELVVRFKKNRKALPAIALTTDSSILTAHSNDFDFSTVFARQVEALGNEGDVIVGISTSGNSENVLKALEIGKNKKLKCIGLAGKDGGKMKDLDLDHLIVVPSDVTARIQESHILIIHIFCSIVDSFFE